MAAPAGTRPGIAAAAVCVLSLAGYVFVHFEVTTDVSEFLPDAEGQTMSALSREILCR